jgi:hypothetical protein
MGIWGELGVFGVALGVVVQEPVAQATKGLGDAAPDFYTPHSLWANSLGPRELVSRRISMALSRRTSFQPVNTVHRS